VLTKRNFNKIIAIHAVQAIQALLVGGSTPYFFDSLSSADSFAIYIVCKIMVALSAIVEALLYIIRDDGLNSLRFVVKSANNSCGGGTCKLSVRIKRTLRINAADNPLTNTTLNG
jgi:hypothetical protein